MLFVECRIVSARCPQRKDVGLCYAESMLGCSRSGTIHDHEIHCISLEIFRKRAPSSFRLSICAFAHDGLLGKILSNLAVSARDGLSHQFLRLHSLAWRKICSAACNYPAAIFIAIVCFLVVTTKSVLASRTSSPWSIGCATSSHPKL